MMIQRSLLLCFIAPLAACSGAVKEDPCPHGICTGAIGDMAMLGGGGGSPDLASGGGCAEAWTCTPWVSSGNSASRTCTDGNKCGTTAAKPAEGPLPLPALDMDYFKCKVEPILDRGCSMLGCHGTETDRAFRVYSRGRLRNNEMVKQVNSCPIGPQMVNLAEMGSGTVMCVGWSAHTQTEWQKNYDNARSFMLGLANPDDSDLLQQAVIGGKAHTGVHLFAKTDPDYQTLKAWLAGAKLGAACNPMGN